MKNSKLIAVEGPDGVGKTTISKKLAKKLNYEYIKTPTNFYIENSRHFKKETPFFSRFFFYCAGVYESCKEAEKFINKGRGVVLDRYLDSLRIYHEILTSLKLDNYLVNFTKPDITIVLLANLDTLIKRINLRENKPADSFLEKDKVFLNKILINYRKLENNDRFITINTEFKTIDQIVDNCLDGIYDKKFELIKNE